MTSFLRTVLLAQGVYYVVTAVWPMIHLRSFLAVTGPKTDLWLVHTVGALILAIGVTLLVGFWVGEPSVPILVLSVGACLVLTTIDVLYVAKRVISPIYLGDAVVEVAILLSVVMGCMA